MPLKSKLLKTSLLAALASLAVAAAVTPASAHDYDRHGGYERDRDSGNEDTVGHLISIHFIDLLNITMRPPAAQYFGRWRLRRCRDFSDLLLILCNVVGGPADV